MVNGFADRPERGNRHQFPLHQPASAVLRIGEALLDQGAIGRRNCLQNLLLLVLVELGDNLDGIVGIEFGNRGRRFDEPQLIHDFVADPLVQLDQDIRVKLAANGVDKLTPFVGVQTLQQVGDVGVMKGLDQRTDAFCVTAIEGFLDGERNVSLAPGQRETIAVELERDEDAPMWRKPPKWTLDGSAGFVVLPSFGGDVSSTCSGACSAAPGVGGMALVHGGYELGNGLGFGLELGYFFAAQSVSGREASLMPNGLSNANAGTADDALRMQGMLAGATVGYHLGEDYPVTFRLGAGVLVGQARDERNGTFATRAGDSYTTFPVASFSSATYFYADPSIRAGFRFADNWELTGIVQAFLMVGIKKPTFDDTIEVGADSDGVGTYMPESMAGSFFVAIAPGANVRYQF